jgi:epsilon-lactone hydrolase
MSSWQSRIIKTVFRVKRFFSPPTGTLDVAKSRAFTEAMAANFRTKFKLKITPISANGVPAEWIDTPESSADRVILYFHGGSYNAGSLKSHRPLVANIAGTVKMRALPVNYRMAPEHIFPAALEDARAAYQWLLDAEYRPEHIIVAGDSAGGGLALALLVSLRDEHRPLPAAAVCMSPWTDLTCTGGSWTTNAQKDVMLDPGELKESARLYLGETDPRTPLASPLFADLHGLPPIMIQAGSEELLLSDSKSFAESARAAGVTVIFEEWEGMQHEWQFAAGVMPESQQAIDHIGWVVQGQFGMDRNEQSG